MDITYILYLITFLAFPIISIIVSSYIKPVWYLRKYLKWIIVFFTIHNILFLLGFSLKGDYSDYFIFSSEYFLFCILVSILRKSKQSNLKPIGTTGTVIMVLGFLQAIPGILFFIISAQNYETDKIYLFSSENDVYQTRRYSCGFVTFEDITYTFETYNSFKYLPFEHLIDKTVFSSSKTELDFYDENFKIKIINSNQIQTLEFSSGNGKKFLKV